MMLPDPERCATCGSRGRVIDSRREHGYRRRRRQCVDCGRKWNTYESFLNVQPAIAARRRRLSSPPPSVVPPAEAAPPASIGPAPKPPSRRTARSRYLGG